MGRVCVRAVSDCARGKGQDTADATTVLQPDLMVVCDSSKIKPEGCVGAPDWVIEVLSPATAKKDQTVKLNLYERHGVREYWIVHPGAEASNRGLKKSVPGLFQLANTGQSPLLCSILLRKAGFSSQNAGTSMYRFSRLLLFQQPAKVREKEPLGGGFVQAFLRGEDGRFGRPVIYDSDEARSALFPDLVFPLVDVFG